jgi:hypothetical protein
MTNFLQENHTAQEGKLRHTANTAAEHSIPTRTTLTFDQKTP